MNNRLVDNVLRISILLGGILLASQCQAQTYWTGWGPGSGSNTNYDFWATFTVNTSAHTITLIVTNDVQNPKASTEEISGIRFAISGASSSSLTSGQGLLATIASGGTYSNPGTQSSLTTSGHWSDLTPTGTTVSVAENKPKSELIIGPDSKGGYNPTTDGGGAYTNANSSITGKQPSVLGVATFVISVPGITSSSTISNVQFSVGTGTAFATIVGTTQFVPEPGAETHIIVALCCIFGYRFKKIRVVRRS